MTDLVVLLDAVHDVEAENATENGSGDDSDIAPFLRANRNHFAAFDVGQTQMLYLHRSFGRIF